MNETSQKALMADLDLDEATSICASRCGSPVQDAPAPPPLSDSFSLCDYSLGEIIIPLKSPDYDDDDDDVVIPPPPTSANSLRTLTRQLSVPRMGVPPPLSPAPKKKSINGISIGALAVPHCSPGSLARSLGPLDSSLHRRQRRRSNSPGHVDSTSHRRQQGNLSSSPRPLDGSMHRRQHQQQRSTSPGPLDSSLHRRMRNRSSSPGQLGGRSRSNSPGTLRGLTASRSFRARRRLSLTRGNSLKACLSRPVSILREGKFSQPLQQQQPLQDASVSSASESSSPCQSPSERQNSSRRLMLRMSTSTHRNRRVSFWFADEESVAGTFATEDSMQLGDLGFDDSGEGLSYVPDIDYERSTRACKPFVDPMDMEVGEYGEAGLNDALDQDTLINRFSGSTIQEEFGMGMGEQSFGEGLNLSLGSLLSEDDTQLNSIKEVEKEASSSPPALDGKRNLSGATMDFSESMSGGFLVEEHIDSSALLRHRPPPAPAGMNASFSSQLSDDSILGFQRAGTEITPKIKNLKKLSNASTESMGSSSEQAFGISTFRDALPSTSDEDVVKKDASISSETSSESPTSVVDYDADGEEDTLQTPSSLGPALVEPIG